MIDYPKWVHPPGGPATIVADAAHEALVMGTGVAPSHDTPEPDPPPLKVVKKKAA